MFITEATLFSKSSVMVSTRTFSYTRTLRVAGAN